jgi:hypothetical protein
MSGIGGDIISHSVSTAAVGRTTVMELDVTIIEVI